ESADRMFHIDTRTEGGRRETDRRFGDSIHSEGGMPQAVLRQSDGHSQQESGGRISPAQAEINGYQKRKFQNRRRSEIHRQERLECQRQNDHDEDGTGVIPMNFYVLVVLGVDFHFGGSVICNHGLSGGCTSDGVTGASAFGSAGEAAGLGVTEATGLGAGGGAGLGGATEPAGLGGAGLDDGADATGTATGLSASFLSASLRKVNSCRVSSTRTSSRPSSRAAGFTDIFRKGV